MIIIMTKKCYAAIRTAKEISVQIKQLIDEINEKGDEVIYDNLMKIAELNDKYLQDFGEVNPYWQPPKNKTFKETYVPPEAMYDEILE